MEAGSLASHGADVGIWLLCWFYVQRVVVRLPSVWAWFVFFWFGGFSFWLFYGFIMTLLRIPVCKDGLSFDMFSNRIGVLGLSVVWMCICLGGFFFMFWVFWR